MPDLPERVRDRLEAAQESNVCPHPDADTLSAFAENAIAGNEREGVMQHLSRCAECRQILALSLPQESTEAVAVTKHHVQGALHRWSVLRWAGVAAAAVTVSAAVLLYHSNTGQQQRIIHTVEKAPEPSQQVGKPEIPAEAEPALPARSSVAALKKEPAAPRSQNEPPNASSPKRRDATETVEVAGAAAPVTSDETKPFAISAEQSRQRALDNFATAPTKPQAEPAQALGRRVAGGAQMQSQYSQAAATQVPKTASAGATLRPDASEDLRQPNANSNATAAAGKDLNIARNGETSNAAFAANRVVSNTASVELNSNNAVTTEPAAELRGITAASASATMAESAAVNWRISEAGKVERSLRNGVWQSMIAANDIHFRAVATSGRSVWAGGSNGALYRSTNSGSSWARISVGSTGQTIAGDVTHIEVRTPQEIEVSTSTGQRWITRDGGNTWQLR